MGSITDTARLLGVAPEAVRRVLEERGVRIVGDAFDLQPGLMKHLRDRLHVPVVQEPDPAKKSLAPSPQRSSNDRRLKKLARGRDVGEAVRGRSRRPVTATGAFTDRQKLTTPYGTFKARLDSRGRPWITLSALAARAGAEPDSIAEHLRLQDWNEGQNPGQVFVPLRAALAYLSSHPRRPPRGTPRAFDHRPVPTRRQNGLPALHETQLPATPAQIADRLNLPLAEVMRRLSDEGFTLRHVDQRISPEHRASAYAAAARGARTTAANDDPELVPDHDVPINAVTAEADARNDPQVRRGDPDRLEKRDTVALRRQVIRGIRAHGDAVRSTRSSNVIYWAGEQTMAMIADVTITGQTPGEGPIPRPGWLLLERSTDLQGRPGAGTLRGLSWLPRPHSSILDLFRWDDAPAGGDGTGEISVSDAIPLDLDQPWPEDPTLTLLGRWWTLMSSGWIDEPTDTPTDDNAPAPQAAVSTAETGAAHVAPPVRFLTWRTPNPVPTASARQAPRRPGKTRRPPVLHIVSEYQRRALVGPGRRYSEWVTVSSHPRGGGPGITGGSGRSCDVSGSGPLIVYELRPPAQETLGRA